MQFYRKATEEDFKVSFQKFDYIPEEVKTQLNLDKKVTAKAVKIHRDMTGRGMIELKEVCLEYCKVLLAYEDFKNGNVVYTQY